MSGGASSEIDIPATDNPLVEKFGFKEEIAENFMAAEFGGYVRTGFPQPQRRLRLIYESERASIEETYFWIWNEIVVVWGFGDVIKTIDTLASAEHSSFWGMIQQRKGIQQDRAAQYLQSIGKMIQDLFKLVREIRILKERLELYEGVKAGKQADDIALKGYWVDMVEGGTKGQANIYTMAQQLGFGTLPDLFFGIFVKDKADVDKVIEEKATEFNDKVKEVLRRKLATYIAWRMHTEEELKNRHRFTLRYLRQHWAIIRMYISWIKPYLRNVQRLEEPDKYDRDAELIRSFEGAMIEIEFVARKAPKKKGGPAPTILASFEYRVKPKMDFHADGYQHKGPVHVGKVEFSLRNYAWTDEDVKAYVDYRDQETLELIGMVDQSVRDAMDALGDELQRYLKEAGEDVSFKSEVNGGHAGHGHESHGHGDGHGDHGHDKKQPGIFEPFGALFGGFKDIFMMPFGSSNKHHHDEHHFGPGHWRGTSKEAKKVMEKTHKSMYLIYKFYKKNHKMVSW